MSEEILKDGKPKKVERREMIKGMFKATLGITAGMALVSTTNIHARPQSMQKTTSTLEPLPENLPKDDLIYRMQQELHESMKKPASERKWAMVGKNGVTWTPITEILGQ